MPDARYRINIFGTILKFAAVNIVRQWVFKAILKDILR